MTSGWESLGRPARTICLSDGQHASFKFHLVILLTPLSQPRTFPWKDPLKVTRGFYFPAPRGHFNLTDVHRTLRSTSMDYIYFKLIWHIHQQRPFTLNHKASHNIFITLKSYKGYPLITMEFDLKINKIIYLGKLYIEFKQYISK